MMPVASDYPITFGYGATDGIYYGPSAKGKATYIGPYHRGDDRAMPVGTAVIVNGVQIGLSGNGNGRYGAHLHIGRFVGGQDTNPNGEGFSLNGAKVVTVVGDYATDPVNAKYVRIQDSSGAEWVYLHMIQVNVKVGDVLNNQGKELTMTPEVEAALNDLKNWILKLNDNDKAQQAALDDLKNWVVDVDKKVTK